MEDLVNSSYKHCFMSLVDSLLKHPDDVDVEECGTENVVRVCSVHQSFQPALYEAIVKIQDAKLKVDLIGFDIPLPGRAVSSPQDGCEPSLGDKLTVLINDIALVMKKLEYALYRGTIYKKCEKAKYTYSFKCDVSTFVNTLAANESFKARLLNTMKKVIDILSDVNCQVIRPITVDYNLVEVNDGHCWSISERRFVKNAIPPKNVGVITPRAYSPYDPHKEPDPKYFKAILENSLSEREIGVFCEDFLRLLNFNKKRHKEKVPCLVGEADSGKTSLFYPILGLIHHNNVATITKQKVFNKAMISQYTEVIFIDEACASMLDVDDWKILTQGGYTACDVKYQSAKSFFNRCPMVLTAQQHLEFKAEDQPAMDRRLRYYNFKSLANPKKKAATWLRKHPMECVVWAATKAHRAEDEVESSDTSDEEGEQEDQTVDGTIPDAEKEILRSLALDKLLHSSSHETPDNQEQSDTNLDSDESEHVGGEESAKNSEEEADCSEDDDEYDLGVARLRKECSSCDTLSLRGRQLKFLLQKAEEQQRLIRKDSKKGGKDKSSIDERPS